MPIRAYIFCSHTGRPTAPNLHSNDAIGNVLNPRAPDQFGAAQQPRLRPHMPIPRNVCSVAMTCMRKSHQQRMGRGTSASARKRRFELLKAPLLNAQEKTYIE
jgi:hypothetical protein